MINVLNSDESQGDGSAANVGNDFQLIKVRTENGKQLVSAKELYDFLGLNSSQWKRWHKKNIEDNKFAREFEDWEGFDMMSNGNETKDFVITLEFAKGLSMMARTQKGEDARRYFVSCEKKLMQVISMEEQALMHATILVAQSKRIQAIENKVEMIINRQEESKTLLLGIDRSEEQVPEESLKAKIRRLVNAYHSATGVNHVDIWNKIYDKLYYAYNISIKSYKKVGNESYLEIADRKGFLDKIFTIASSELTFNKVA